MAHPYYHFEWDPAKAAANLKKHGISLEQATETFKDPMAITVMMKTTVATTIDGLHSAKSSNSVI